MKYLFYITGAIVIVVLTYWYVSWDFYVWKLKHPQAPQWTYLWGN